jgi:hypothetical protein
VLQLTGSALAMSSILMAQWNLCSMFLLASAAAILVAALAARQRALVALT